IGTSIGTPAYMAPEQAAGDPDTDHRADIYAFGCMAYELIAGRGPFPDLPPHKLVVAHMSETPRSVAELRHDCPAELVSLVMQCLAKEPGSRPASATELLRRLDGVASPSGASAAMPAILIGGRSMLWRALGIYVAAFLGVALLTRAAIIAIGLPDWVFPAALVVMALGLPMVLFTAYTQYVTRRAATATPTYTPNGTPSVGHGHGTMATLAIKASPHISWKRTVRGGIMAVSALVLLTAGYMVMRVLGIGPAGSLMASGKLSASDKVLVAAFDAPGADSSLGVTIAEAVRTNLSDSRAVHVMPTSSVVAALEQMQRPPTARVDFATAREIAQRTGAKAVVAGSIVPAGGGYIVTARLVEATTGNDLASYRESARDAGDLIAAVDRLTKSLRGKIGESLKTVRDAPLLSQVTTASLGALRSYAAGLHANDIEGDYAGAVQHFRDAVRQDSTFAMAYVQMSYSLQALGGPNAAAAQDSALRTGYRLRERLPERERYNVEGAYYMSAEPDRKLAIPALERAVALDSTNVDAVNNLAVTLDAARQYPRAERMYRLALASEPSNGTLLTNLANMYTMMGRHAAFDSVMAVLERDSVPFPTSANRFNEFVARRDFDAAERESRIQADTANPRRALAARDRLSSLFVVRGRLREAERMSAQVVDAWFRVRGDSANLHVRTAFEAMIHGTLRGNAARGLALLDSTIRARPLAAVPISRVPYFWFPMAYAQLGRPATAREMFNQFTARLDTVERKQRAVYLARAYGFIMLGEGKADSAISWFRRGDLEADGLATGDCAPCTLLFLGLAFDRAGQADSARTYLARYVASPGGLGVDQLYLAPAMFRLGELYRDAGDTKRAGEYYGRFIDLWKIADPELQPRVTEARKRLAELVKAKG
ncbi:MAG: protein kinase, partial [Gemmatimonadales bacterium]|nr:protein kinase [Gemmatimonadales bacterium]